MLAPPEVRLGCEVPRIWTKPLRPLTPETTRGFEAITFAEDVLGITLFPWQRWLLIHALELTPDGRFRFRTVVVLVARQNGKTLLVNVLTLWRMFVDLAGLVIGTAQNLDVAEEAWGAAVDMVEGVPELADEVEHVDRTNGKKALRLTLSRRYKVQAANRRGGRGLSGDLVVLDELREHQKWDAWAAVTKTTMARERPQIWALSNAGDDTSVVLTHLRATAIEQIESGETVGVIGLFEYSAPEDAEVTDVDALAQANPSMGYKIPLDALLEAARTDPEPTFRVECMCQWVTDLDDRPRLFPKWPDRCMDVSLEIERGSVAFGVDVSWDRKTSWVAAAGMFENGQVWAEIIGEGGGSDWLRPWLTDPERLEHSDVVAVAMQANGAPVSTVHDEMVAREELKDLLRGMDGGDVARACGRLYDAIEAGTLSISRNASLDAAAEWALPRTIGDAWVIDRKRSKVDTAPLVALAAAVWALLGHVETQDSPPPNCW